MNKLIAIILCGIMAQHCYANLTKVVDIDRNADIVTVEDFNGHQWKFGGCDDWEEGDMCNLTMFDCGTEDITDDRIMSERYERSDF